MDSSPSQPSYTIILLGDLMLGRLIDQLLPQHVHEPTEARHVASFLRSRPHLKSYNHVSPWGNTLPVLHSADLLLGNLETAVTTHTAKWPDKVFNYRMHPANVACLIEAGVDYVSLANNHTLDFGEQGLVDTVRTIGDAGIAFAGAGRTVEEARKPAVLTLPSRKSETSRRETDGGDGGNVEQNSHPIHLYAFSDHPRDWARVPQFNLLSYNSQFRHDVKFQLAPPTALAAPSLKIVSVHWGPNYAWHPASSIVSMAHFLIDECGVDIIHGHSSHHIQGVELYRGKLIIYGCGDFVDDYAVTREFRNDLSAAWRVTVAETAEQETTGQDPSRGGSGLAEDVAAAKSKLIPIKLEVFPNRITHFQAGFLDKSDPDHAWVSNKFRRLCADFGTKVEDELGEQGQIVVDLTWQGQAKTSSE